MNHCTVTVKATPRNSTSLTNQKRGAIIKYIFFSITRKILLSDGDVYIPILHKIDTLLNNNKISHSCIRHDHLINPVCINVTDKQLSTKDVQCIPDMYDCEAVCRIKSYKGVHL